MNFLSLIPNPFSKIPGYDQAIKGRDYKPLNSYSIHNDNLQDKRILKNELT